MLCRLVRLVLYGFFVISATVGLVIALAQLPGGLANAPGALPTQGTLEVSFNQILFCFFLSAIPKDIMRYISASESALELCGPGNRHRHWGNRGLVPSVPFRLEGKCLLLCSSQASHFDCLSLHTATLTDLEMISKVY